MKKILKFIRLVRVEVMILVPVSAGFGMAVGIFAYGDQQTGSIADPTAYQNFSIFAGAVLGVIICLLTALLYFLIRKLLHYRGFHYRFYLVFTGAAGMAIGVASDAAIVLFSSSFGVTEHASTFGAMLEGASFGVFGIIAGVVVGAVLNLIRGYNS
jgi:hypothetical protein